MNKWSVTGLALPAILGLAWIGYFRMADKPAVRPRPAETLATAAGSLPDEITVPSANVPRTAVPQIGSAMPTARTETMSAKALQDLLDKDPKAALLAARESLTRDPDGPDAAERNWVVVKSLAMLGRLDEARREAEVMVPKFRGTRWADDVERHVLAHP